MIPPTKLAALLSKVQRETELRDEALRDLRLRTDRRLPAPTSTAASPVESSSQQPLQHLEHAIEFATTGIDSQLLPLAERSADLASQIRSAARGAESSHGRVRAMDARLHHVQEALEVVRAVATQQFSAAEVAGAVDRGEYEAAVRHIVQYDSVAAVVADFPADLFIARQQQQQQQQTAKDTTTNNKKPKKKKRLEHLRRTPKEDGNNTGAAAAAAGASDFVVVSSDPDDDDDDDDDAGSGTPSLGGGSGRGSEEVPSFSSFADGSNASSSGGPPPPSAVILKSREQLRESLRVEFDAACNANLEPSVRRFATMLAQLGFGDEARDAYTAYVVRTTTHDLDSFVDTALQDVGSGKTTHLVACVSVLDRIAAAMESHKPFVDEHLSGHAAKLIAALDETATAHCVKVLRDFLASRRGVVGRTSSSGSSGVGGGDGAAGRRRGGGGSAGTSPSADPRSLDQTLEDISHLLTCCHQYLAFVQSNAENDEEAAAAGGGGRRTTAKTSGTENEKDGPNSKPPPKQQHQQSSSPLLTELSALLGIYVPVQREYLAAAYGVMRKQCDEAVAAALHPLSDALQLHAESSTAAAAAGAGGTGGGGGSIADTVLNTIWGGHSGSSNAAAAGSAHRPLSVRGISGGAAGGDVLPASEVYIGSPRLDAVLSDVRVTLVDDAFHLLLGTIRRAMATGDVSIASATLITVNEWITDQLLPELQRRMEAAAAAPIGYSADSSSSLAALTSYVTSRIRLRWLQAAHSAIDYTVKLGLDSEHAAAERFRGSDAFRLTEQRHDFSTSAAQLRERVGTWVTAEAERVAIAFGHAAGIDLSSSSSSSASTDSASSPTPTAVTAEQLLASSSCGALYVLRTEQGYLAAGLEEHWAHRGIAALGVCLAHVQPPLFPEALRDRIVIEALQRVAAGLEQFVSRGVYDALGALLLERHVRLVRNAFSERTDAPVREKLARLQGMLSVLMADSAAEAEADPPATMDLASVRWLCSRRLDLLA